MAPPPSYPAEQVDETDAFDFDMDGNALSPESKRKMMEEQRAIMEQIKKQAMENKASEAAVRANAFETRMMGQGAPVSAPAPTVAPREMSGDVDVAGFGASEIEEQRAILEQIEREAKKNRGGSNYESPDLALTRAQEDAVPNMHDGFHTTEEIKQIDEDRKLAEMLQNEENAAVSDYPANRGRAGASSSRSANAAAPAESSWWGSLMDSMGVSTGDDGVGEKRSAEIDISRPPGSSSRRALHGVTTGAEQDYEREGLLSSGGSSAPAAAHVAQSKPLFSCVVDSVSHAANYAAAGLPSMGEDDEEVHGVDTTSFLAVPKVGDDRGPTGSYSVIPNDN